MRSADFLTSSLIILDVRISLGHIIGSFGHSWPAFLVNFFIVHEWIENAVDCRKSCQDYLSHLEPFRHSVTGDALFAAIKMDSHHLVYYTARRIYFVQDPRTYSPRRCWSAITSDSGFMKSSCRLQSELRLFLWDWLTFASWLPFVTTIVARV